jgi:hypothetical protein
VSAEDRFPSYFVTRGFCPRQTLGPKSAQPIHAVLRVCRKLGASSVFARTKGRCHLPRMAQVDGNAQAMLLMRQPVLGYQEMMVTIRCHEKEARVGALVLTSPAPAWTAEMPPLAACTLTEASVWRCAPASP